MTDKQHREDLAGYDLGFTGDGGYTTGTIRVITEPIPVTAVVDFLHKDGLVSAAVELQKERSQDHELILSTALVPELRDGARVVRATRCGGGSFSYYSPEQTPGSDVVQVVIDVSEPLRRLLAAGRG